MNEWIHLDWFVLVLVGLGTMLLLGEILVKMRGVFALLGLILITLYFYYYLSDPLTVITMLVVYFIGLLLIIIDGKFISDGTLALLGIIALLISVALSAPNFTAGLYAVIGVIFGITISFLFLKIFPRRNMWSKIALTDRLTKEKGYSSLSDEYAQLQNKKGRTITTLRPVGTVIIDGEKYSAMTNGKWIEKGEKIIVIDVDGTKILVEKLSE